MTQDGPSTQSTSHAFEPVPAEAWMRPGELPRQDYPLPALNPNLIPDALRPWILDSAERIGVPPEAILVGALTAVATIAGNTIRVQPKNLDDEWTQAPNLFAAIVGHSGAGKSPALAEGLRFLKRLQKGRLEAFSEGANLRKAKNKAAEIRLKEIETRLAKAKTDGETRELEEKYAEALESQRQARITPRRYFINDTTVEKVAMIMGEQANRGGLLLMRDELSGLLELMHRAGHENDRSFYLEGANGTSSYDVSRVSREAVSIPVMTLSMIGGMQPTVIEPLVQTARSGLGDDGLLPRFQLAVWIEKSTAGINRQADGTAIARAEAIFQAIERAALDRETRLGQTEFKAVSFTDEAQVRIDQWWEQVHARASGPAAQDNVGYSTHLAKGFSAVSRLSLLYFVIAQADGGNEESITLQHAEQAINLMNLLHEHARRTYRTNESKDDAALRDLRACIESGEVFDRMSTRELQRAIKRFGQYKADQLRLLRRAEDLGWLRLTRVREPRKPPSMVIEINPQLL
jgi:hypothetical protein